MKEIVIRKDEANQRFDKFLQKYFKEASMGFLYKMLRKKNITLNNKKATGKEKIEVGDVVKIFMSDETVDKFRGKSDISIIDNVNLNIIYEDEDVLMVNKPSGMLSQKASANDI